MMKYVVVIIVVLAGFILALSPMLFAGVAVHPDRIWQAQWAGFILLAGGVGLGHQAIALGNKAKTE